jgi:hypothetical protein
MQMMDPNTLELSTWAENGPYTGATSTNAGAYSSVRGDVVIFDSLNDVLRAFDSGQVGGGGTVIGPALGGGFASEFARLIEVRRDDPVGVVGSGPTASPDPLDAFPNPFTEGTTVSFRTAESGMVRMEIYDTAGRLVRSLGPRYAARGPHRVSWDGRDESGAGVAPGIYFARVRCGITVRTTKIVRGR